MNLFRRKGRAAPVAPDLSNVEQAPLSVFQADDAPAASRHDTSEAVDVPFVDVSEPRDDDVPFGPELPDHVVAAPERERRKRRVRLGSSGTGREDNGSTNTDSIPAAVELEPETPADAKTVASDAPERKKSRWSFAKKDQAAAAGPEAASVSGEPPAPEVVKPAKVRAEKGSLKARLSALSKRKPKAAKSTTNYPVRVLIGYLPEVTERDALSFALGVAEKHVENIENAYYDVFAHQGGFVYEVHEGGSGAAFVPAILDYFDSLGPFRSEVEARMHIRTATRTVEVIRKPSQIEAVLLPESAGMQTTPQPDATQSMRLAMNKRTGLLVAGAGIFITGFFAAIIIGTFMRLVPADDVRQPPAQKLDVAELPAGQWASRLQNVPDGKYVKALRYDKKAKWRTENADVLEQAAPTAAPQPTTPPAGN